MIANAPTLVLCTHNPRHDFLERVIKGCEDQRTPEGGEIERVIVDSASSIPIGTQYTGQCDHLVRCDVPGLARARIAGIRRSSGDLVVFVDDDTVLSANYIEEGLRILCERPYLGAIGGQLIPEYEGPLPLSEHYYRNYLAIREFDKAQWSNRWDDFATSPIGGGMIVRRPVAEAWADRAEKSSWRLALGRNGGSLSGGEDIDLLQMACEMGYGKGIFPELKLAHLMPAHRLKPEFLVKIYEGNCRSGAFYAAMMNERFLIPPNRIRHRLKTWLLRQGLARLDRRIDVAGERGRRRGWYQALETKSQMTGHVALTDSHGINFSSLLP
jgi:glycosyltransferase involved in cell wall biosynthesis